MPHPSNHLLPAATRSVKPDKAWQAWERAFQI